MANSDPEHEIRNVESPEYRPINSGDTNAGINLIYPSTESGGDKYRQGCYGERKAPRGFYDRSQQVSLDLFSCFCHPTNLVANM